MGERSGSLQTVADMGLARLPDRPGPCSVVQPGCERSITACQLALALGFRLLGTLATAIHGHQLGRGQH